jgi:putative ABC transport system permease protein
VDNFLQDLKYALRTLRRSPTFTAVAVLTLALGIGATTVIFSVVNSVLLTPLPFAEPDRLVSVWEHNLPLNHPRNPVSAGNFQEWRNRARSFEQIAAFADFDYNLTGIDVPERVHSKAVSAEFFSVLGVTPLRGRAFRREDEAPGAPPVVLVTDALWQRQFGRDSSLLGRTIALNGISQEVVGILPPDFEFFGQPAEIWAPLTLELNEDAYRGRWLSVIGRLNPGVDVDRARAEMIGLASQLREEQPEHNPSWSANVIGLKETLVGDIRPALLVLLGAVILLQLIACANVANLLLARAAVREKEMALRATLGASQSRVLAQLLTEGLTLALAGGVLGVVLASGGRDLIRTLLPPDLSVPGISRLTIDARVLGFSLLITLATGLLFGLAPAFTSVRLNLQDPLRAAGRSSATAHRARFRDALVVAEVSLALVLLLGAGLLAKSLARLSDVDAGLRPAGLYEMQVTLPNSTYPEGIQQAGFFEQLEQRIRNIPGVQSTGAISFLPLTGLRSATGFVIEGRPFPTHGQEPIGDMRAVTPGYFETMGIPLLRGRGIEPGDRANAPDVAVISRTLADRLFPGENPLGRRLIYEWGDTTYAEIVGIAGDVHHENLATAPFMEIYRPAAQFPYPFMSVVVRSGEDPGRLSTAIRSEVRQLDGDQPAGTLRPITDLLADTLARPRLNALLLGLFGVVGLTLAGLGIYGLMSYSVVQRTQEIGIRMALGAERRTVVLLVMRRGVVLAAAGISLGLAGALVLTGMLTRLLYGVSPRDPLTFVVIPLFLALVALLASLIPAARASRVDPIVAMRAE